MGRRKIEIKPLLHERNRSVTFSKRRNGLFKKAHELAILCSVDVAVIIFERPGNNTKLFQYGSSNINEIVQRHIRYDGEKETRGPKDFSGSEKTARVGDLDEDEDDIEDEDDDAATGLHDASDSKHREDGQRSVSSEPALVSAPALSVSHQYQRQLEERTLDSNRATNDRPRLAHTYARLQSPHSSKRPRLDIVPPYPLARSRSSSDDFLPYHLPSSSSSSHSNRDYTFRLPPSSSSSSYPPSSFRPGHGSPHTPSPILFRPESPGGSRTSSGYGSRSTSSTSEYGGLYGFSRPRAAPPDRNWNAFNATISDVEGRGNRGASSTGGITGRLTQADFGIEWPVHSAGGPAAGHEGKDGVSVRAGNPGWLELLPPSDKVLY